MQFTSLHKQRKYILITALAGIIAAFLPWITVSAGFFGASISRSTNGFHGAGVLAFLSFTATTVIVFLGNRASPLDKAMWLVVLSAGVVAVLSVIIFIIHSSGSLGSLGFADAGLGFGVYIAMAAAAGVTASAWLLKSPGDSLENSFDSLKKSVQKPTGTSKIDQLEKLANLKDEGKISEEEYQELKSNIL